MNNLKSLTIQNNLNELQRISEFLERKMKNWGIEDNKIAEVQIAVDEVFSNIIQYSCPSNKKAKIELTCNRYNGSFEIVIKNYGKPFNPISAYSNPDLTSNLEDRNGGGLGIYFLKTLMDELRYEYCETGKYETLTMLKNI